MSQPPHPASAKSEPVGPQRLYGDHRRRFESNRFVYPVLSRRSDGISIGVNLNPDKVCNFDCIYCQVDRVEPSETRFVEQEAMLAELDDMLALVRSGQLYESPKFADVPQTKRRLNDIAFSGDGEPTTYRNFDDIIAEAAALKQRHQLEQVKLVLITNASMFHRPHVRRGLTTLMANKGEIWAKLETGTEEYYEIIERTKVPFAQVLDNITWAARQWPIVIQSMFLRLDDEPPSADELSAYCDRLEEIQQAGGTVKLVQVYTVARRPAESNVTPLADEEVDHIVALVEERTGITAKAYYGSSSL